MSNPKSPSTLSISLPRAMREWIEAQVAGGRYHNVSEYIRDLIRRDQDREAERKLERLLLEGLESGEGVDASPEFWQSVRKELATRAKEFKRRA